MGIVGMPNVGKSTLFNVLTKMGIPAENFPFCTIEPNQVCTSRSATTNSTLLHQWPAGKAAGAAAHCAVADGSMCTLRCMYSQLLQLMGLQCHKQQRQQRQPGCHNACDSSSTLAASLRRPAHRSNMLTAATTTVAAAAQARVNVPDDRFNWLVNTYKPKSAVSAYLDICDIAGLVK
jgi:hypothetical protein